MEISFYNTLSRKIEKFETLEKNKVSIYSCGPTVYDSSHIGHARSAIVWDLLVRFLRYAKYEVLWARNITDIDDKIINRASELKIHPEKLARIESFKFWKDMYALNISTPDFEPKASENIGIMINFIEALINKNFAYRTETGDVYFRVSAFPNYGKLKNLNREKEISRIEHTQNKESDSDFALWKNFDETSYCFDSPFGKGRPGWHLECSAMIKKYFGNTIDIHGGGEDLIFPHHENEIAQSEALNGCPFAKYWLHNGMIMINGRKMSKSENNYITINESLEKYSANAIRFFILTAHYRQALNYTEEALISSQNTINKLFKNLKNIDLNNIENNLNKEILNNFDLAMSNDLNSPKALAIVFEAIKTNDLKDLNTAFYILKILGFNLSEDTSNKEFNLDNFEDLFNLLLDLRKQAKENKNYELADKIRDSFSKAGFQIKDSKEKSEVIRI